MNSVVGLNGPGIKIYIGTGAIVSLSTPSFLYILKTINKLFGDVLSSSRNKYRVPGKFISELDRIQILELPIPSTHTIGRSKKLE